MGRPFILTSHQQEEAIALYQDGWSQARVADEFSCNQQTIGNYLRIANVAARSRGAWRLTPLSQERLLQGIQRDDVTGCWNWTGCLDGHGYGVVRHKGKNYLVHRLAYQYWVGKLPGELDCCHKCDNPRCINPDHLFSGSAADNIRDAIAKGRVPQLSTKH
jgi:hypothetical protein